MNPKLELALKRLSLAQNLNPEKIVEIFRMMVTLMEEGQPSISLISTFLHDSEIEPGDYVPTLTFSLTRVPDVEQSD